MDTLMRIILWTGLAGLIALVVLVVGVTFAVIFHPELIADHPPERR